MTKRAIHRMLELAVGLPCLIVGGSFIAADIGSAIWISAEPDRRWGFVGVGTFVGLLPFLIGCWLVFRPLVVRHRRESDRLPTA